MDVYFFSSKTITNIWAGVGARVWAVGKAEGSHLASLRTKAAKMKIGSLGVLYCSEIQAFTTPFVVVSTPDAIVEVENIWPETWILPFRIDPLGTPDRILTKDKALTVLPVLRGEMNISQALPLPPVTAFTPAKCSEEDWAVIIGCLAKT